MINSTKANKLVPKTAAKLNKSEDLVQDVVNFYYTAVRKCLESLEEPYIRIPSLGTFNVSKRKLGQSIEKLESMLEAKDKETFEKIKKYNITKEMCEKQKRLYNKITELTNERDQRKKDLEAQSGNLGRTEE